MLYGAEELEELELSQKIWLGHSRAKDLLFLHPLRLSFTFIYQEKNWNKSDSHWSTGHGKLFVNWGSPIFNIEKIYGVSINRGPPQMDGKPPKKINDLWVPIFFGSPHIPTPKHQVLNFSNGSKTINLKRLGSIGLDLVSITTELLHCSGPFSLLGIGT